jgi:DNA-directed RNA polymerase I subunit RPA1
MTASRELKTPTMSVPLRDEVADNEAVKLTRTFAKLTLNELIAGHQGVSVKETLTRSESGLWQRAYFVTLKFHPAERIKTAFGLTLDEIATVVAKTFVPALSFQMKLELRRAATEGDAVVSVEGGESSDYVHVASKDDNEESHAKGNDRNGMDMLEDDDDDDDTVDEPGVEDGVKASRAQEESYGGRDDDDGSVSSGESSQEEKSDNGNKDARSSRVSFSAPTSIPFVGDSSLKLDKKQNAIHLQPLRVDPSARPILMVGLVEKAATKTLVRSRKNIDQAFINEEEEGRGRCLQIAGINFSEIWKLENVDHNRLMSNDIWAVRCAYGVEAARNTIVDQIRGVFGVYGIEVDPRHLSLIADYMTFSGDYTALNRTGMREMSSPFLQMSFETTAQFLTQAALTSASDDLQSPSANLVVGRPIRHGTGAFSLLVE